jgi:hypothetical protein
MLRSYCGLTNTLRRKFVFALLPGNGLRWARTRSIRCRLIAHVKRFIHEKDSHGRAVLRGVRPHWPEGYALEATSPAVREGPQWIIL